VSANTPDPGFAGLPGDGVEDRGRMPPAGHDRLARDPSSTADHPSKGGAFPPLPGSWPECRPRRVRGAGTDAAGRRVETNDRRRTMSTPHAGSGPPHGRAHVGRAPAGLARWRRSTGARTVSAGSPSPHVVSACSPSPCAASSARSRWSGRSAREVGAALALRTSDGSGVLSRRRDLGARRGCCQAES
jgi:hypothetical protein